MCFSGYMETQDKDQKYCYNNNLTAVCSSTSSKVIIYETYLLLYCIILYIGLLHANLIYNHWLCSLRYVCYSLITLSCVY